MIPFIISLLSYLAIYLGWLCFIFIILCPWLIRKKYYRKTNYLVFSLSILFLWSHYIEPQIILTKEETINQLGFNADIILIADIHLGFYKNHHYLQRVADKINNIPADYVVIAGDFIFDTSPKHYKKYFKPLAKINKPVYAVRGNHDYPSEQKNYLRSYKFIMSILLNKRRLTLVVIN